MRAKFNLFLQLEDETTGQIVRSTRADIYLDIPDKCSFDYMKESIIKACDETINIIKDVE